MSAPTTSRRRLWRLRRPHPAITAVASLMMVAAFAVTMNAQAADGNLGTGAIEIDGTTNANLYPSPATDCTSADAFDQTPTTGVIDWVKSCSGTFPTPNAQSKGALNGFRVVDGVAGADQDIFLTGGKEQQLSTWNPGPGSVGSSKYDITQAYIANNSSDAFFGMERRGNNGTTAFDWEFNRFAPSAGNPDYIPTRAECDVLVTFEMQGSGGSGSATAFLFRYDDPAVANTGTGGALDCTGYSPASGYAGDTAQAGHYVAVAAPGVLSSINNAPTHSAPWGTVDSKGNWTTADIDRFEFAEAKVPLSLLGITGSDTCTAISRYLQVRTRSSSTDNSDLKDLTKITHFDFSAPVNPTATLTTNCSAQFHFASSLSTGTPQWTFSIPDSPNATTVDLNGAGTTTVTDNGHSNTTNSTTWSASGLSGDVQVVFPAGVDSVAIDVDQSATSGSNNCATSSHDTITVYRTQSGTASITPKCDGTFDWSVNVDGGQGPYDLTVDLQHQELVSGVNTWVTKSTVSATDDADGALTGSYPTTAGATADPGTWRVHFSATDAAGCVFSTDSPTQELRAPLAATASKVAATTVGSTLTAGLTATQTGALTGDTLAYKWQLGLPDGSGGTTWTDLAGKTTKDTTYNAFKTDATAAPVTFSVASGDATGSYKGSMWSVKVRVIITRTVEEGAVDLVCSDTSAPITLKVVEGVDP